MTESFDEPLGEPELTGDAVIDEALVRLDGLEGRPVDEHPAEFERVHRVLRDALSGVGREPDTAP